MTATRTERVRILLTLDKSAADAHEADVRTVISTGPPAIIEGGVLKVNYAFWIEYFGSVERRLEAVNRLLLDPAVILDADLEELSTGRCLIAGVLKNIDAIHQKMEARRKD